MQPFRTNARIKSHRELARLSVCAAAKLGRRPALHGFDFSMAGRLGVGLCLLGASVNAQIFVRNSSDVPNQTGTVQRYIEDVDFADVDLDGDWDAAFAHGGDFGNIQDRIWINQGGLQSGTLGVFADETGSRFPVVARDGRDTEFVDFDGDGDFDLYISNMSEPSLQTSQWFTNQGGFEGGSIGFYIDDTATRWLKIGEGDSSVPASLLIGGGFVDWSGDGDFGDLDNDGDLDLVHSSHGGSMSGTVPTRIFLNNGLGYFEEFNPSGYLLTGSNIPAGAPGLWCEGVHTPNTTDTTGAFCDIASDATDIDLGDIDGDFDLDLLHGGRADAPRFYLNRLEENGGAVGDLSFRDVSNSIFPPSWATGSGHYEQELGDFDGDNDLDLYGINWQVTLGVFNDVVMTNTGGSFGPFTTLPESASDDNEADFGDYDNDGDLDVYVANFAGVDRLYRNNGSGVYSVLSGAETGLNNSGLFPSALDADWCDVDGDGDYDIFASEDGSRPVLYWQNMTQTPDTTAPRVSPTENVGPQTAGINGSDDFPVRTHVYDNAPYYTTWYNDTTLIVEVDGIRIDTIAALTSGGQVFRSELPSNLVGEVTYRFESADQYGNTGVSVDTTYTAATGLTPEIAYGTGTVGTTGFVHEIHVRGLATANKNLYLSIETNSTPTIYIMAIASAPVAPTPITDLGILNIDPFNIIVQRIGVTNASGIHSRKIPLTSTLPGGFSVYAQIFGFDGAGGDTYSSSRGLEIPFH